MTDEEEILIRKALTAGIAELKRSKAEAARLTAENEELRKLVLKELSAEGQAAENWALAEQYREALERALEYVPDYVAVQVRTDLQFTNGNVDVLPVVHVDPKDAPPMGGLPGVERR